MKRPAALEHAFALAFYAAASILIFGRGVLSAPGSTVVGDAGADKTISMWSLVWWPHALARGHDPFDANVVWAPKGIDLAWVTSIPGPSLVATPLTETAGPVVAYNVLILAAPVLAAWAAFLLARRLTGSFWPSVTAGWIFGFSAYEVGHMVGHLNLVLVFPVPLCALLVVKHLAGELSTRRFVVLLALALCAQFVISTELFATLVLVAALFALLAAWRFAPAARQRLRGTLEAGVAALLLCLLVVSPYLVHAFLVSGTGYAPLRSPLQESADLLNYVVPTRRIWLRPPGSGTVADHFTATGAERGAYLGLPLLAVVVLFGLGRWRETRRAILLLGYAALLVASFGPELRLRGHDVVPGPWKLPAKLPVTDTILPVRLTLYLALLTGLIAALWLAEGGRRKALRWALVLVGIAVVLPNPAARLWRADVPESRFFTGGRDATAIRPGETALVFPFGGAGWSLLWQAQDGMRFRLVDGHMGRKLIPAEERWRPVYTALAGGPRPPDIKRQLELFVREHRVAVIVLAPGTTPRARRLMGLLGLPPKRVADAVVYRVAARAVASSSRDRTSSLR